jgi:hypothetical protein
MLSGRQAQAYCRGQVIKVIPESLGDVVQKSHSRRPTLPTPIRWPGDPMELIYIPSLRPRQNTWLSRRLSNGTQTVFKHLSLVFDKLPSFQQLGLKEKLALLKLNLFLN